MINRYNILNGFVMMLALLCSSCISTEDYEVNTNHSGTIEFVCRPTSYNGQIINTKAVSVDDFENKIYNCYFMLYNEAGDRVYGPIDLNATLSTQRFSKSNFKAQVYTACFVANVPKSIIDGLNTLQTVNNTIIDIAYSSADVSDIDNSNKPSSFVVPEFVLEDGGEAVQCIPMFGMEKCDVAAHDLFNISLKRLFAKVTVRVGLGSFDSSFKVVAAHLFNLPTRVKLSEPLDEESKWVKDASAFLQQQIEGPIGHQITSSLSSAYELYFYVPEYYLNGRDDRSGNYGNEKFKPNMYDTDKNPVLFRLFGEYGGLTGGDTGVQYDLYLGENAATSFTLKRNKHYINSMVINGITNHIDGKDNKLDCRVIVSEDGLDEMEIIGQTANCYIIGKTGSYIYPACKGVHKGGLNNIPEEIMCFRGTDIEIIAQNNENITLENLAYNPESKEFSFDITNVVDGSAVVALTYQDGGEKKIEWSWHLWFVSGFNIGTFETDWFDMKTQSMPNGKMMMDRNLGANVQSLTPGTVNGFYYKYGHWAPYFEDVKYNAGKAYHGYAESERKDWEENDKSTTDPCPPGYRVPASSVWSGTATDDHAGWPYNAFLYYDNGTNDIYYPYSGFLDNNDVLQSVGDLAEPEILTMDEVKLPHEQNPWGTTTSYGDLRRPTYPQRFLEVKYRIHNLHTLGAVSTADKKKFEYSYINKGIEIIECTFQRGTWDEEKINIGSNWFPIYISNYNANYTGNKLLINEQNITGEQLKNKYPTQYEDLIRRIEVIRAGGVIQNWLGGYTSDAKSSADQSLDLSYGYQVRCVKE